MPVSLVNLLVFIWILIVAAFIFWPERGLFWTWQRMKRLTGRVLATDALKHILNSELEGNNATLSSIAGALEIPEDAAAKVMETAVERGFVSARANRYTLTAEGRDAALHVVRAHRLWERHLADRTGTPESDWHAQAEEREHFITPEEADDLAEQLGNPAFDPHGDPIPGPDGDMVFKPGVPLTDISAGDAARVLAIEDEPKIIFAQIAAIGLRPGMLLRVTESDNVRIKFWSDAGEHVLAPVAAANVSVEIAPDAAEEELDDSEPLSAMRPGERAEVIRISKACRAAERRRFMDLGILPGTKICAELSSSSGNPKAYRIRNALIALRREQADLIYVKSRSEGICE